MRRFFTSMIAIFFPWLTLILSDNPGGAVVAMIMQATIIGWPFASVWALRVARESREKVEEQTAKSNEKQG